MISVDKAVIARLDSHGCHFEILVDPEKALDVKKGKEIPLDDLIASQEVFEDCGKGLRASDENINKAFGTNDFQKIAYAIIRKGEVQLTTEQRRRMREERRKQIADIISRQGINPQTNTPHPPQRILHAMDEAHVQVNELERAEEQVDRIVNALKVMLPISMDKSKISVRIPAQYAGKAYGRVREFGTLLKEEWRNDGSWVGIIEIPAGITGDFYNLLNSLTKGEAETKEVE
jgi:ribosome maturation protein SDO1